MTPGSTSNGASMHQKQPPAKVALAVMADMDADVDADAAADGGDAGWACKSVGSMADMARAVATAAAKTMVKNIERIRDTCFS